MEWSGVVNRCQILDVFDFCRSTDFFSKRIVIICIIISALSPIFLLNITDRYMNVFHDGALIRCVFGFACGLLCWQIPSGIMTFKMPKLLDNIFEILSVFFVTLFVIKVGSTNISVTAPFLFSIVLIIFSRARGLISSILTSRTMIFNGTLSYSIYLIHSFIIFRYINVVSAVARKTGLPLIEYDGTAAKLTASPFVNFLLVAILFAGVLAMAWLSYRFIEEPGRDYGKRLARNWSSAKPIRK